MNDSLLTLDLGNTSLGGMCFVHGRPVFGFRLPHDAQPDAELQAALASVGRVLGVAVPGRSLALDWPGLPRLELVGALPGRVLYDDPGELGADRHLAALGAHVRHGPALVVDCGTAVTLTHIDADATIRGCAISAGHATLRHGIGAAAPALEPFLGGSPPAAAVPRGTRDNLAIGVDTAWVGLVTGLVEDAVRRLSAAGVARGELLFTGSDGWRAWRAVGRGRHAPSLVHFGLHAVAG